MLTRRQTLQLGLAAGATLAMPAILRAQGARIKIGMSGWTGFAPLTLAEKAGLFKKNGVDVETVFIPQSGRLAALASGAIQAVATTVDTQLLWSSTVPLTQVLVLDKSNGGDGIGAKGDIASIADLKGKTIGVDGAGTTPYFVLAYILKKNGMSMKDVKLTTLAPQPAANALAAGQVDAASTYEPYLSTIRDDPKVGKIIATTVDYPVVIDTLAFPSADVAKSGDAIKGIVAGFFDALVMIREKADEANGIMGARVNMAAEKFAASAKFIAWQDKAMNQKLMGGELQAFMDFAADIQLEAGVLKTKPDLKTLLDKSFVA